MLRPALNAGPFVEDKSISNPYEQEVSLYWLGVLLSTIEHKPSSTCFSPVVASRPPFPFVLPFTRGPRVMILEGAVAGISMKMHPIVTIRLLPDFGGVQMVTEPRTLGLANANSDPGQRESYDRH
ncbi:hypothetical protein Tco_0490005 [Tanacetum coccineum]